MAEQENMKRYMGEFVAGESGDSASGEGSVTSARAVLD